MALASALATLLGAEAAARLADFDATPRVQRTGVLALVNVEDEDLGFVTAPDCQFETVYGFGDWRQPLVVRGTTNGQGFRGPECPRQRSAARRIACLGDSYTFGEGVADDETWPAQLAPALARARPGLEVEVLNFGVNAYDTCQEVRLLETHVFEYQPDLVLLAYFLNDASIREPGPLQGHEYGELSSLYRALTTYEPLLALRRWSRLADGLADRIVRREYLVFLGESRSRLYTQDAPGWHRSREALVRARDLCAARGIDFVVLLYPLLVPRGERLATHEAYQVVADFCRASGTEVLDLEPAFLGHDVNELRVHPADAHPNPAGHRIAADAIAEYLAASRRFD